MYKLHSKLKTLKLALRAFNSKHYGSLLLKVAKAKAKLEAIQLKVQSDPNPNSIAEENRALEEYIHLTFAEEAFFKQKAWDNVIKAGNKNTSYFHRKVKAHCSRNKILSILDDQGKRHEDYEDVKKIFIEHYKKLLGSPFDYPHEAAHFVAEVMQSDLPQDSLRSLELEVTDEEIRNTLFALPSHKAPGLDGYTSHFFKFVWSIVGEDFTNAIKSFFDSGKMLRAINSTIIAPVPKVPNPSKVTDYRPISCCSTIYKCISKIIANILKTIMPLIISPSQATFVKGRSISDQVLLMQELVCNYHRQNLSPQCALKIDLMKAFVKGRSYEGCCLTS